MENITNKPKKNGVAVTSKSNTSKSKKTKKIISEEDIRNRAFEIYLDNRNSPSSEQDHWLHAESELRVHNN